MTTTRIRYCRFKSNGEELTGQILADKGLGFSVLPDGSEDPMFVHKKHITCQWEEGEPNADPAPEIPVEPIDPTSLMGQLAGRESRPQKKKAELPKAGEGEKTIQLKALCADFQIHPRIARRRLRKELGQVGTGHRWEWPINSPELEKVKAILVAQVVEEDAPLVKPEPEPEPTSGMDAPVEG